MKKLLVFGMTPHMGGVETFIINYYRHFDPSLKVDFLVYNSLPRFNEEMTARGDRIFVVTGRQANLIRHRKEMKRFFKEYASEYSAIWCNQCTLSDVSPLIYAKKNGIKKRVIHSHNSENMGGNLTGLLHLLNKLRIRKLATDFWACSDFAGKFFFNKAIREQSGYKVVPNAIEPNKFRFNPETRRSVREAMNAENAFVVGHIGRFHFQKNHSFLIRIFAEIKRMNQNAILWLIGEGEERVHIERQAGEAGLSKDIRFLGLRSDIPELMQAMDVFVLPSKFEGLGIVLLEAQAAGLKCFAASSVPDEAKITELLEYIPLEKNPEFWAKKIMLDIDYNRPDTFEEVSQKGFNIAEQVAGLQDYFFL